MKQIARAEPGFEYWVVLLKMLITTLFRSSIVIVFTHGIHMKLNKMMHLKLLA